MIPSRADARNRKQASGWRNLRDGEMSRAAANRANSGHSMSNAKSFVVAVAGATGAVGREMLKTLEERRFPISRLVPLASKRSAGHKLPWKGGEITIEELGPKSLE